MGTYNLSPLRMALFYNICNDILKEFKVILKTIYCTNHVYKLLILIKISYKNITIEII